MFENLTQTVSKSSSLELWLKKLSSEMRVKIFQSLNFFDVLLTALGMKILYKLGRIFLDIQVEIEKPYTSTKKFLPSSTWELVVHYVREIRKPELGGLRHWSSKIVRSWNWVHKSTSTRLLIYLQFWVIQNKNLCFRWRCWTWNLHTGKLLSLGRKNRWKWWGESF